MALIYKKFLSRTALYFIFLYVVVFSLWFLFSNTPGLPYDSAGSTCIYTNEWKLVDGNKYHVDDGIIIGFGDDDETEVGIKEAEKTDADNIDSNLNSISYFQRTAFNPTRILLGYNVIDKLLTPKNTRYSPRAVTLTTQLSFDRVDHLIKQISAWRAPVSATLFISLDQLDDLILLYNKVVLMQHYLVVSVIIQKDDNDRYPINLLRNVAIENAPTRWIFNLDVDLVPSLQSHFLWTKFDLNPSGNVPKLVAYVVPAFEIDADYENQLPHTKEELKKLCDMGVARPFYMNSFPRGHRDTNYPRWWENNEITNEEEGDGISSDEKQVSNIEDKAMWYQVNNIHEGYEPYLILDKVSMPRFDDRFMDRYKDKIVHTLALIQGGYEFLVVPDVFAVHLNHPETATGMKLKNQKERNFELFEKAKKEMNYGMAVGGEHIQDRFPCLFSL